jgi:small subunit ribosomal protein S17e
MGRSKSVGVKALGNDMIKHHGDRFSDDFSKNKESLSELKNIKSKKIRNVTAGYITKEIKKIKKSGL